MATLNSLMKHLRSKGIAISGSSQKRKLKNIGYYHGYKGYRFFNEANRPLPIKSFDEIVFVNDIDMQLKTLLYPQLIFIETALKNYTLEAILKDSKSEQMEDIWSKCLTGYRELTGKEYREAWEKRLRLRNELDSAIYSNHKNRDVIRHFWMNDRPIPIWAIFEVITLGNFGNFFACLKSSVKWDIARDLGMPSNLDSPKVLTSIIFTLKDLRNAVAHNGIVFDVRFKQAGVSGSIGMLINQEMKIGGVDFNSITDYVLLIVYLMKCMKCSKTECKKFISSYRAIVDNCYKGLPYNFYNMIIESNARNKLRLATEFVQSM